MIYDLQKGSMTKRISAFLFDFIILTVLVTGVALLLSWALGYDGYVSTFNSRFEYYQEEYDVTFNITQEELDKLSKEEQDRFHEATKALNDDKDAVYAYGMMVNLALVIITGSVLVAYLLSEFLVPLKFGNGQTLGKKIFGLAVMREDGVKLNTISLFTRTVLGKFTIETMVPLLVMILILFANLGMVGTVILFGLLITQIVMLIVTRTNSCIHDKLANTVVVDMASQMIFGSDLEMIAYKQKMQAEKAARQKYF